MERNYNVSGADRKQLVKAIGDALGIRPKYMGTPSFAFQIGSYEVTKHGVLIFEKDEQTANVLAAIEAAGFMAEQSEGDVLTDGSENDAEEIPQEEGTQITGIEAMAQTTEEHIMEESAPIASQEDITNLSISMRGKPSPTLHWRIWVPCSKAKGISSKQLLTSRRQTIR